MKNYTDQFNLNMKIPQVVSKQTHHQNIATSTHNESFHIALYRLF